MVSDELIVDVEKVTPGGRMLARHHGRVVLVWGSIPGERVRVRVERSAKGVLFAETVEVLAASPDRRPVAADWRCGGNVFAHVHYPRQLALKGEIIADAFGRIGGMPQAGRPEVVGSPEQGYRMRARLHAHGSRLGFYREGTHQLCAAAGTGQLLPETNAWIAAAERILAREGLDGLAALELAENAAADERVCHLEWHGSGSPEGWTALAGPGLTGLSVGGSDRRGIAVLAGSPWVHDAIRLDACAAGPVLRLRRDVRSFFQGNRFLLERLVQQVIRLAGDARLLDLYAGVGLFGLAAAACGAEEVTLVEGDPIGGADLAENAAPFERRVQVHRTSVETFLASAHRAPGTVILDPPRSGASAEAMAGLLRLQAPRIVYVSCDVATLARDARRLVDGGYGLDGLSGVDLFPNTAHVETIGVFSRSG